MKEFEFSNRLKSLPPYLFAEIDKQKQLLKSQGVSFIDLSIGDPDISAPVEMVDALYHAAKLKENQKYALDQGKYSLRKEIKVWMQKRFQVNLDENNKILPLIGSKEGIVHFPLSIVNKGDYVIIPSPGYPGYRGAAIFADAKIYEMPLLEKNGFLPDLNKIPLRVRNKAKVMYLNYPNNPTTAVAPASFLEEVVAFCRKYEIIIAYDNAYSEIYYQNKPQSILEIKDALDVAIEFHSFSKTFCVTGMRLGWAAGNSSLIKALLKMKSNVDSGVFPAIQESGVEALKIYDQYTDNLRSIFKKRRDSFLQGLKQTSLGKAYADAAFYVWVKIPKAYKSSIEYASYLLTKKRIVATPGVGFGKYGERFIRFALTVDVEKLQECIGLLKGRN